MLKNSSALDVTPTKMREGAATKTLMKKHASMNIYNGGDKHTIDKPTINRVQVVKVSISFSD